MKERLDKMLEFITDTMDAALVTKPVNMRYLTGYVGEGLLFVGKKRYIVITDFRYTEMVQQQAPQCEVIETSSERTAMNIISELIQSEGIKKLGYEDDYITVKGFSNYQEKIENAKNIEFVPLTGQAEQMRDIKDDSEIESIAQAVSIGDRAFSHILNMLHTGISEKSIALELEYFMRKNGAEDKAFESIVASGPNSSMPHAVPGDRLIQKGDLVTLDFGCKVNGYCSDMTRTVAIGSLDDELLKVYEAVRTAQQIALDALNKPGDRIGKDIDAVARDYLEQRYPGRFGHGLGHGVGLLIHEGSSLSRLNEKPLPVRAVVTVEPGVYLPGKGGVRIEDTVLVTETGIRVFTSSDKSLIIV